MKEPTVWERAARNAYEAVLRQTYGCTIDNLSRPEDEAERIAMLEKIFRDAAVRGVLKMVEGISDAAMKAIETDPALATPMAIRYLCEEVKFWKGEFYG